MCACVYQIQANAHSHACNSRRTAKCAVGYHRRCAYGTSSMRMPSLGGLQTPSTNRFGSSELQDSRRLRPFWNMPTPNRPRAIAKLVYIEEYYKCHTVTSAHIHTDTHIEIHSTAHVHEWHKRTSNCSIRICVRQ